MTTLIHYRRNEDDSCAALDAMAGVMLVVLSIFFFAYGFPKLQNGEKNVNQSNSNTNSQASATLYDSVLSAQ